MKEALKLALEALDAHEYGVARIIVHEALAQPERQWVGLTEEELKPLCDEWRIVYGGWVDNFARFIEQLLKDKNT